MAALCVLAAVGIIGPETRERHVGFCSEKYCRGAGIHNGLGILHTVHECFSFRHPPPQHPPRYRHIQTRTSAHTVVLIRFGFLDAAARPPLWTADRLALLLQGTTSAPSRRRDGKSGSRDDPLGEIVWSVLRGLVWLAGSMRRSPCPLWEIDGAGLGGKVMRHRFVASRCRACNWNLWNCLAGRWDVDCCKHG